LSRSCRTFRVCGSVESLFRPTSHNRHTRRRGFAAPQGLASKTFYPAAAQPARANLCPFATNARRRSMLWSKVASISRLAPTDRLLFHGGRRAPYGLWLMASPWPAQLASLMRASINYRLMRATKPLSVAAETLSPQSYVFADNTRQSRRVSTGRRDYSTTEDLFTEGIMSNWCYVTSPTVFSV